MLRISMDRWSDSWQATVVFLFDTHLLLCRMTGGPGCSSQVAMFYENGPYHLTSNLTLEINPYSWNTKANVIWIDQPVSSIEQQRNTVKSLFFGYAECCWLDCWPAAELLFICADHCALPVCLWCQVGTGFSYSDDGEQGVANEAEMADIMWRFLQQFLVQYPKYSQLPLFITGESYAVNEAQHISMSTACYCCTAVFSSILLSCCFS